MLRLARAVLIGTATSVLIAAPAWADGGSGHHRHHHQRSGTEQTTQEPTGDPSGDDTSTVATGPIDTAPAPDGSLDNGTTSAPSDVPEAATPDAGTSDDGASTTGDVPVSPSPADNAGAPSDDASEPALDSPSSVSSGDQTVTITGVAVAVSTSGGNSIDGPGSASGSPSPAPGNISTGGATAVGNQDQTTVNQQATTTLSGGATATVRQVTIVFNVGVAGANTGANGGGTTGSGTSGAGTIGTGDATAVGNDSDTYLTQAGAVTASDGTSDSSNQVTVTVRMGVAVADSGGNSVAGGSGSGSVSTGTATATGNNSLTDVSQTATLTGSGVSQLTVEQQALILNLGVAFANSGMNDVNGLANALLNSPSQDIAEQLFNTLLPALLASTAVGGGANVSTGNAVAVGNQSQTYVDQTATATASGDGTATISQNVVVANFGAAVANTGLNGSGGTVALDPQMVTDLAAFFNSLLTSLDEWAAGDGASQHLSLVVPFGDLLIALDGDLIGVATAVGSGMEGASAASITQLTAVISLGVSYANTGLNTTTGGGSLPTGDPASAPSILTGDVSAINTSIVIVCQLDDDLAHRCLAPVVSSEPPAVDSSAGTVRDPAVASSPSVAARELPATGADATLLVRVAALLLLAGLVMAVAGRRATRTEHLV